MLNRDSLQSSIQRHFGLNIDNRRIPLLNRGFVHGPMSALQGPLSSVHGLLSRSPVIGMLRPLSCLHAMGPKNQADFTKYNCAFTPLMPDPNYITECRSIRRFLSRKLRIHSLRVLFLLLKLRIAPRKLRIVPYIPAARSQGREFIRAKDFLHLPFFPCTRRISRSL